jgi:hypothetical protein
MSEKITELLKKFEQEHEVYVSVEDAKSYWLLTARIPKKGESLHHVHRVKTYISGRDEEGNILVLPDTAYDEAYSIENWGKMETFDDFVKKALERILADKEEADRGEQEECGTCG